VLFLDQLRKFVCGVFNLAKDVFRVFFGASYDNQNCVVLGSELILGISKVADGLAVVAASGKPGAQIWASEQRDVEAHSIGTIDEGSLLRDSGKRFSTVRTLQRVSLQRSTPVAGTISVRTVSEIGPEGDKLSVRETPFLAALQVAETTQAQKPVFRVRKRTDCRTGAIG
jgi:hypothetical protein